MPAAGAAPLLQMKGPKIVTRRLRFRCGCCARCRLQSLFWAAHQARTRRDAMAIRWQADMVRPQMGGAVGNGTLHARGSALYLAGFDLCPAKRARGRTGDSALLGDSRSRPHIRFEDGAKGELARRMGGATCPPKLNERRRKRTHQLLFVGRWVSQGLNRSYVLVQRQLK
jgi:hypothetical protein